MRKYWLALLLLFLIGCDTSAVEEQPLESCENALTEFCKIKTSEFKGFEEAFKSVGDFYETKQRLDFDIRSRDIPPTIFICPNKKECEKYLRCKSNSMSPVFTCNDKLSAYKPTSKELAVGDIIGFKSKEHPDADFILHRIIDIKEEGYITKGDNNYEPDDYVVQFGDILFKVVKIEYA